MKNIKKIIREEMDDMGWMDDTSSLSAKLPFSEMEALLERVLENTKYRIETSEDYFNIRDYTGIYTDFTNLDYEELSIDDVLETLDVNDTMVLSPTTRSEYIELSNVIKKHFNEH